MVRIRKDNILTLSCNSPVSEKGLNKGLYQLGTAAIALYDHQLSLPFSFLVFDLIIIEMLFVCFAALLAFMSKLTRTESFEMFLIALDGT